MAGADATTGWHGQACACVVPPTTGALTLKIAAGTTRTDLVYARPAGVKHAVIGANPSELVFVEAEPRAHPGSGGIGCSFLPVRFRRPPEIVVVTLRAQMAAAGEG